MAYGHVDQASTQQKQLMMWGVILGFSLLLAGLEKYNMWPESWNLNRHPNKVQMAPMN